MSTSYHFDCGNSNEGPVGFCARINADSEEKAIARLKELLPESYEIYSSNGEYIAVYFGGENVVEADIDDWTTEDA